MSDYTVTLTVRDNSTGREQSRSVTAGAGLVEDDKGFIVVVNKVRVSLSEALHVERA